MDKAGAITTAKHCQLGDFAATSLGFFDRVDSNHDGCLDDKELGQAAGDCSFKGVEAEALTALLKDSKDIAAFADTGKGITKDGLKSFQSAVENRLGIGSASYFYFGSPVSDQNFKLLDADGNGRISKAELVQRNSQMEKNDFNKPAVKYLLESFDKVVAPGKDSLSSAELKAVCDSLRAKNDNLIAVEHTLNRVASMTNTNSAKNLYGDNADPLKNISPAAIKQGNIGDCYVEAGLASIAYANPSFLASLISDNRNGTYSVKFPGQVPVVLKNPTETELNLYNQRGVYGYWPSLLEKAYGVVVERQGRSGRTPQEALDAGGWSRDVFQTMLGDKASKVGVLGEKKYEDRSWLKGAKLDEICETRDRLKKMLASAVEQKQPLVCSSHVNNGQTTPDQFYRSHAYSIIGFDPNGAGGGTLSLRNPWGNKGEFRGDVDKISLDRFRENFDVLEIGASAKAK